MQGRAVLFTLSAGVIYSHYTHWSNSAVTDISSANTVSPPVHCITHHNFPAPPPTTPCLSQHYGLTEGWVQNLKALYLPYFLQCAMVGSTIGLCDGHTIPGPDPPLHTEENMAGMKA